MKLINHPVHVELFPDKVLSAPAEASQVPLGLKATLLMRPWWAGQWWSSLTATVSHSRTHDNDARNAGHLRRLNLERVLAVAMERPSA